MKIIDVHGLASPSRIFVGERLENLSRYLDSNSAVLIADRNVHRLHGAAFPPWPLILVDGGEARKTLDTVRSIYRDLLELRIDRSAFIVGIGGGIVCDIAGFVASTYLRGLRHGFVATSLLAQVDASVGGKTGVNLDGYKNIVGAFHQPEFVLCDPFVLKTLPAREVGIGFAEVIKHGFIAEPRLLSVLEERADRAKALDPVLMTEIVHDSILVKSAIVGRDEHEAGERKILNFGHTLAHALEKVEAISHGEAVALGMIFALKLSLRKGILKEAHVLDRLIRLLCLYDLPVDLARDPEPVFQAMIKDKKKSGEAIDFILLEDIGKPRPVMIPLSVLREDVHDLCQSA